MKLSKAQIRALQFLAVKPWSAPWWGGKPHTGWPDEMKPSTYSYLRGAGLITSNPGEWAEKIVSITAAGRALIADE